MRQRRELLRVAMAWTILLLLAAIALAGQAVLSLERGEQACFFNFPAVPCPRNDDPAVARLTFALVGLPLIWFLGIGLVVIARVRQDRRGNRSA